MRRKGILMTLLFLWVYLVGMGILLYPAINNYYTSKRMESSVSTTSASLRSWRSATVSGSSPCVSRSRRSVSVLWKAPVRLSPLPGAKTVIPPQGSTRRMVFPQKRLPPPSMMPSVSLERRKPLWWQAPCSAGTRPPPTPKITMPRAYLSKITERGMQDEV